MSGLVIFAVPDVSDSSPTLKFRKKICTLRCNDMMYLYGPGVYLPSKTISTCNSCIPTNDGHNKIHTFIHKFIRTFSILHTSTGCDNIRLTGGGYGQNSLQYLHLYDDYQLKVEIFGDRYSL